VAPLVKIISVALQPKNPAACALAYWAAGMDLFDAICNSFSTLATAGFSTHDASFAYWNSPIIETIAIVFMTLGAINFSVHFLAWRRLSLRYYRDDSETRVFLTIIGLIVLLYTAMLFWTSNYPGFWQTLRYALFHVVSIITTTGFTTTNFSEWPLFLPLLLAIIAFNGGCAGSTVGGVKVVRMMLLYKQGLRELAPDSPERRLYHQDRQKDHAQLGHGFSVGIYFTLSIEHHDPHPGDDGYGAGCGNGVFGGLRQHQQYGCGPE